MQKRDAMPAGSAPGRLVDQAIAGLLAARQRGVEIRNTVADVMNAGTAFGKELRHGTRRIGRLEQLDVDRPEMQAHDRGTVGCFRVAGSKTEDVTVERQGF